MAWHSDSEWPADLRPRHFWRGKIMNLCRDYMKDNKERYSLDDAIGLAAAHKARQGDLPGAPNYDQAIAFTKYGYNGTSPASTSLKNCPVDPKKISKTDQVFNWVWEPGKPRQSYYPGMTKK